MSTEIDLFDERESLSRIRDYARAHMVSPRALLFSVILRVLVSAGPGVMIPAFIGSPKPLNLVVVTVGQSGLGKTAGDDVAELYWPADFPVYPFGTAEGTIQALDPDEDGQPQTPSIIFASSEIDTWAALGERAGSLTFPVLRQIVTGDQLGQKNASKAHTRIVAKRSYCVGISLSAQPGSNGARVLFADAPGGFPQRCLFGPADDPDAPDELPEPVEPYQPDQVPDFTPNVGTHYEIPFPDSVGVEIRTHRRKVLRGDPGVNPLDGHRNLTKTRVAAALMIMEGHNEVTEDDWRIAGRIMEVSDDTRAKLIAAVEHNARAANRAKAHAVAERDEVVASTKMVRTKNTLLKHLIDKKELPRHELRKRLRSDQRDYFDAAISELIDERKVFAGGAENSTIYRLMANGPKESTWTESPRPKSQVSDGGHKVHVDNPSNVTAIDSRRSPATGRPKSPARQWFDAHIDELRQAGHDTAASFAVYSAGESAGHTREQLRSAANTHPDVSVIDRSAGNSTWDITGTADRMRYQSADQWAIDYFKALPVGSTVDKDAYQRAAKAAGHSWDAARHAATASGLIRSERGEGTRTVWVITAADDDEGESA